MAKSPKTSRRSIKRRKRPSSRNKRSAGLRKWVFVCVVGACTAVGIFALLRYSSNGERAADRGGRPEVMPEPSSTPAAPQITDPEQEIPALKKEEMELVQTLMRDFPDNVEAVEQMGNFYSRHGQRSDAVACWKKCLKIDPDYFNAHRGLGLVALDRGEYQQAFEHYQTAARIRPRADGICAKMGEALVGLGRYDDAIRELLEEISISPQSATAHFLLGQAYLKQKDYEKAQSSYEKALELNPNYANACYGLARVFVGLKQPEKARQYQEKFRTFRADDNKNVFDDRKMGTVDYLASARAGAAQALLDAEKLYRAARDFKTSEALLLRAVVLAPDNPVCFERLGLLYSMTNRFEQALRQFERMSQIQPDNPRCYLNIGTISLRLGRFPQAEIAYQKVIQVAPLESLGYRKLAQLYLNTNKKLAEAGRLARKAVEMEPSAENLFVLGWACDVNGDRDEAVRMIERAVRMDPDNLKYRQVYERIKSRF